MLVETGAIWFYCTLDGMRISGCSTLATRSMIFLRQIAKGGSKSSQLSVQKSKLLTTDVLRRSIKTSLGGSRLLPVLLPMSALSGIKHHQRLQLSPRLPNDGPPARTRVSPSKKAKQSTAGK